MEKYIKNLGKVRPTSNGNWDKNKEYDILSIVKDKQTRNIYISKKYVPANIEITNTEYWDNIIDNSLDVHFYDYVKFENLNTESTAEEINKALHTLDGEYRFPKSGDVLLDLENDISSVFLYTEHPAALDERPANVSYLVNYAYGMDVRVKNIIFHGTNYENTICVIQVDVYSSNDLKNKIDKNINDINKLNVEIRNFIPNNKIGKANGVASLNESGKVPSNQLPSYVDDVIYVERIIDRFENSGRVDNSYYAYIGEDEDKGIYKGYIKDSVLVEPFYTDKIYVLNQKSIINETTYNANSSIRWNGIKLVEIGGAHLVIGEIEGTAFDGKRGKNNEDVLNSHINNKANPHEVTKAQIGLDNVTNDPQVKRSEMGVANGVPILDENGKLKDENLNIINVPNIEDHYGILVKKNMATPDSISVVEASEIFKQFQSINPTSSSCVIKANEPMFIDGMLQYIISSVNNPKFEQVLNAYNTGSPIIIELYTNRMLTEKHRIMIDNWCLQTENMLVASIFAYHGFNYKGLQIAISNKNGGIDGTITTFPNYANEEKPGVMSISSYRDIIECKEAIRNIKVPLIVNINYTNNNFNIANNEELKEKFKNAVINKDPIEFHITNFYTNVDEEIIIVNANSTNKIINNDDGGNFLTSINYYNASGVFIDNKNNKIKINVDYNHILSEFTINANIEKFVCSVKQDSNGNAIVSGVPNILDEFEIEYDSKLVNLINKDTILSIKNLNLINKHYSFNLQYNELIFTKIHNDSYIHEYLKKLFRLDVDKKNNTLRLSITNGGELDDLITDVNKLKDIDSGDGEMLVAGGSNPFISEMAADGFNISYTYKSPILGSIGEGNINIPIAGNTTVGLLPKGYKSKIDNIGLKVNSLNNFGLVGKILVKLDNDGFIDKSSIVYLNTGNNDIAGFDTSSSPENACLEIPKTTIEITNIGIENVGTEGTTGFTITSSKEVDKFIINITHVELQNKQPIIINLYNFE